MQTYRIETIIAKNKTLSIKDLPFHEGEKVEVIVRSRDKLERENLYPLRGIPFHLDSPYDPVAEDEWEIL